MPISLTAIFNLQCPSSAFGPILIRSLAISLLCPLPLCSFTKRSSCQVHFLHFTKSKIEKKIHDYLGPCKPNQRCIQFYQIFEPRNRKNTFKCPKFTRVGQQLQKSSCLTMLTIKSCSSRHVSGSSIRASRSEKATKLHLCFHIRKGPFILHCYCLELPIYAVKAYRGFKFHRWHPTPLWLNNQRSRFINQGLGFESYSILYH